jgi:hypothetical protein
MAVKKINPQTGQTYTVLPAPGGTVHVYPDGRRVFVKAGTPAPAAPGQFNAADQAAWQGIGQRMGLGQAAAPGEAPVTPDSQYFIDAASRQARIGADLTDNDQQGVRSKAAYDEALRRLQADQPKSEAGAKSSANRSGLFYSSNLDNSLNEIATQYARQRSDAKSTFDQGEAARLAARRAIEAGGTVDDAAAIAASTDRQVGRDTDAADSGALAVTPAPAAPAVKVVRPTVKKKPYGTVTARGKVFHVYNSGRRVAVRPVARP